MRLEFCGCFRLYIDEEKWIRLNKSSTAAAIQTMLVSIETI